jgi:hypothetical protein
VSPADYLADAWKRLEWANGDGETLQRRTRDFRDLDPYGIWIERDGRRWKAQHRRLIEPADEAIWFEEFARLLGSFLDHSRAALNYLAVQLGHRAIRENPSLASENLPYRQQLRPQGLEFPLFRVQTKFEAANHVRRLPDDIYNAMEAVQPYPGRDRDGLWFLQDLAVQYRHSIIHPVSLWPLSEQHNVLIDGDPIAVEDIEIVTDDSPDDHDVIFHFTLPDDVSPDSHVDAQVAMDIGINSPDFAGKRLMETINAISQDGTVVMNTFEEQFFL